MGGSIGELDFPLPIRGWSGINRVFLRAPVDDRAHVLSGGPPEDQRIDLLKCQITFPDLFLLLPHTVVAQVELVHSKMQMCPVGRDLIENRFVAAGIDQLSAEARAIRFEVYAYLESPIHLADPIARERLGQSRTCDSARRQKDMKNNLAHKRPFFSVVKSEYLEPRLIQHAIKPMRGPVKLRLDIP